MGVKCFYSTDSGAPSLTGQSGSLVNLLKKCLVDGYGSKAPLGWTGLYSSDYARGGFQPALGSKMWLYCADLTGDTTSVKYAACYGMETLTGFDGSKNPTGTTNRFPSAAQMAKGTFWWKSTTADGVARPWWLIGDEYCFYMGVDYSTNGAWYSNYFFGDFISYRLGDAYNCMIVGDTTEGSQTNYFCYCDGAYGGGSSTFSKYMARDYTNLGLSLLTFWDAPMVGSSYFGYRGVIYPNPVNNGLVIAGPPTVHELAAGGNILRGRMPGLYYPAHPRSLVHGITVAGIDGLSGRTLQHFLATNGSNTNAALLLDITGPWR